MKNLTKPASSRCCLKICPKISNVVKTFLANKCQNSRAKWGNNSFLLATSIALESRANCAKVESIYFRRFGY